MLKLNNIEKIFNNDQNNSSVLSGITAAFDRVHSYALTGPSGCGKSTLMHIMAGIDTPTAGSVKLQEKSLSLYADQERACAIVLITQHSFLIKELSVEENVCLAGQILKMDKNQIKMLAHKYLLLVDLYEIRNQLVGTLSGGQRHRVTIARALLVKPLFLCADEITGSLDEKTGQEIILFLKTFCAQEKIGLIISSHNPSIVAHMDLVFELKNGILNCH